MPGPDCLLHYLLQRYSEPVAPAAGVTVTPPNPAAAAAKRKRRGVPVTVQAGATSSGFLPEAAGNDGPKRLKETVVPRPAPSSTTSAGRRAHRELHDAAASNVFEETPESYYLHSVSTSYVNILDENAVNIDTALGAFDAGLKEGNEEGGDDNEVEEIEKGVI
ncbi:uncharacterized protein LOC104581300 isoform X3 [Brachypodium distachyon]|uniref:uncharacterized protein LOC104581300 isoform X3 n=1 Tax=Brachypodium distachyon TaxID=15368 RepID=UPI00071C23BF|nr:uncharacterized protein LOC104581300 isoform X3 [Brachypodium distachyon]|eukprot:XP_024316903.1 uncharacterized protein LOC104581300 isoform X3 [Brachypodium distachyon]